jgi:hypothetical protein
LGLPQLEEWAWVSLNQRLGNPAHLLLTVNPLPSQAGDVPVFNSYRSHKGTVPNTCRARSSQLEFQIRVKVRT